MRSIPEELLSLVEKPARYIGREWNAITKDPASSDLRWALCFPDVYEVGMSHLGLRILYHTLNRLDGVLAERAFMPWPDYTALLERHDAPLATLENGLPLSEFDIVGFSLQYELSYPTVAKMLRLGGIAPRAADRDEAAPLVIGGGPCALNPEPLAALFDAFVLGEAEEAIVEVTEAVREAKRSGGSKPETLSKLGAIPGVYVPSLYAARYDGDRFAGLEPNEGAPAEIERRFIADLEGSAFPTAPIVPYVDAVHDRVSIEVTRGCTRGCRFCHAGMTTRPTRERSVSAIVDLARESIDNTGYDEISLLSLSTADYSEIGTLCDALLKEFEGEHVNLSLPSLRADAFSVELSQKVATVRKSGITLAAEAGTQRLRDAINKQVTDAQILEAARAAFSAGHQQIKLYFMVGLPTETAEDLQGIADLLDEIWRLAASLKVRRRGQLGNVSLATFVPKAHTPFQWERMLTVDEVQERQRFLAARINSKRWRLRWHDAHQSLVEGMLTRGDRRLGPVIERVARDGVGLEAWDEHFSLERWQAACAEEGVDPGWYLDERAVTAPLPWDHISTGVRREFLAQEMLLARQGVTTPDCRQDGCRACGDFCRHAG